MIKVILLLGCLCILIAGCTTLESQHETSTLVTEEEFLVTN